MKALTLVPFLFFSAAQANTGFVERIPQGRSATLEAKDGDLFVVRSKAGVSEVELRAISGLKAWLGKELGPAGQSTPYLIDVNRKEAQYLDPNTGAYVKLPFSAFM
jgi:hypothetical protein